MKSKLLIVACLVIVLSMALILPLSIVNADYSDIINDPNSIVNFNQYILDNYTHNYNCSLYANYLSNYVIQNEHKYYLSLDVSFTSGVHSLEYALADNSFTTVIPTITNGDNKIIFTSNKQNARVDLYTRDSGVLINYCILIDLTQMFGQNSEPSLAQCRELFVADYYPYNTGSPLAIGNLQGYAQGMADAYSSMDITLNQYLVGSSAFAYNNTTITGSNITFDNNVNAYLFSGVIGIPLLDTVKQGTNFEVDFDLWNTQTGESASYYSEPLNFGYVDSNNNLITIASIPVTTFVSNTTILFKGSFVLPISTDTIYLWLSYDLRSEPNSDYTDSYIATKSNITFRSYNVAAMIKTSYSEGYNSVISYYQYGGQGYHDIYELGYQNGLNAENPYTFANLMSSVVEAPLQAVLSIFNFDFLGYNFRNVITLILTLCIILAIIRLFLGMGASE